MATPFEPLGPLYQAQWAPSVAISSAQVKSELLQLINRCNSLVTVLNATEDLADANASGVASAITGVQANASQIASVLSVANNALAIASSIKGGVDPANIAYVTSTGALISSYTDKSVIVLRDGAFGFVADNPNGKFDSGRVVRIINAISPTSGNRSVTVHTSWPETSFTPVYYLATGESIDLLAVRIASGGVYWMVLNINRTVQRADPGFWELNSGETVTLLWSHPRVISFNLVGASHNVCYMPEITDQWVGESFLIAAGCNGTGNRQVVLSVPPSPSVTQVIGGSQLETGGTDISVLRNQIVRMTAGPKIRGVNTDNRYIWLAQKWYETP